MPDLTTFSLIAAVLCSLIVGQAAFRADTLRVQIHVAPSIEQTGFNAAIAEEVFAATASRLTEGDSLIPPPTLRVRGQPGLVGALAKSMAMSDLVSAAQDGLGIENMTVTAAMTRPDPKTVAKAAPPAGGPAQTNAAAPPLELVLVVSQAGRGLDQTRIRQPHGTDPISLVEQGAFWTMERVAPYRVVFAEFLAATHVGNGDMTRARETALRVLSRRWEVEQSSERAMIYNSLALMALFDNDPGQAETQLRLAELVPGVQSAVRGALAFNHAMLAVARKRPGEAREWFQAGQKLASGIAIPDFDINLKVMDALVLWSNGDLTGAEAALRAAVKAAPESESAHFYLAQVLDLKGDRAGSAEALSAAQAARRFDPKHQALVVSLFWVDPVKGETRLRR
ncbi:MAG: tetratricopeptide repeat protein [Acetobacteraceae bacterium]